MMRWAILEYVRQHPRQSAWQIANALGYAAGSVSGILKRMLDEGTVTRTAGLGPRGGFGYRVKT